MTTKAYFNDEIVLEGESQSGDLIHWIFSDATQDSFHWRGERSSDQGRSWFLYEDLDAKRISLGQSLNGSQSKRQRERV